LITCAGEMPAIKIRLNTEKSDDRPWCIIADGEEYLADQIVAHVPSWSSRDEVSPGKFRWHMNYDGYLRWDSDHAVAWIFP
jgi:hypothetical protein